MEILMYCSIVIGMVLLSEVGGYFWHRFGAHKNILPLVKKTHDIHHTIIDDQAYGDFLYVCILLSLYFGLLLYVYYYAYITRALFLYLYIPVVLTFLMNFYIHRAYHIENHWLNKYEWFQNDKRIHLQHHIDETKNFGIITHMTDHILDTFDYGFPVNNIK
jgi:lathosterol oxidase